jgi:hypothetical protein
MTTFADFAKKDLRENKDISVKDLAETARKFQREDLGDSFCYETSYKIGKTFPRKPELVLADEEAFAAVALQLCTEAAINAKKGESKQGFYDFSRTIYSYFQMERMVVLVEGNRIYGFATVSPSCKCHTTIGHFQSFVPGCGSVMLSHLERQIKEARWFPRQLVLGSFESAKGFWQKMGFVSINDRFPTRMFKSVDKRNPELFDCLFS